MRRRDLLMMGATAAASLAARAVFAQPQAGLVRGAVVIGVDKAGDLPKLSAAASGARMVHDWLTAEGFESILFIDDAQPVTLSPIFKAVKDFVTRGTLDRLVVYFSGHGFLGQGTEWWMLSEAPENPNEAISVAECIDRGRAVGIPNVTLISDACRSIPSSPQIAAVTGSVIFPNPPDANNAGDVDRFYAALPGKAALELPIAESAGKFEGIFTSCFLEAFKNPDPDMVETLTGGERVVPNRRLRAYLVREVQKRAQARSIALNQLPFAEVVSEDDIYIGHVPSTWQVTASLPPPPPETIIDFASSALSGVDVRVMFDPEARGPSDASQTAQQAGFAEARDAVLAGDTPRQFAQRTGLSITGAIVDLAVASESVTATIIEGGDGEQAPAIVSVDTRDARGSSIVLQFRDGTGAVVAALQGFVANVVVDQSGVSNISYIPALNSDRWSEYQSERGRVDELRAVVAAAAKFGAFKIEGNRAERSQKAADLADTIRVLKGIDPTLGVYAAYAYDQAGLPDRVRSVREFMHGDLGIDIFDVAMLAGNLSGQSPPYPDPTVPFCPMLTQGWSLLRVRQVRLLPDVEQVREHLRTSLWTSFNREGVEILIRMLRGSPT